MSQHPDPLHCAAVTRSALLHNMHIDWSQKEIKQCAHIVKYYLLTHHKLLWIWDSIDWIHGALDIYDWIPFHLKFSSAMDTIYVLNMFILIAVFYSLFCSYCPNSLGALFLRFWLNKLEKLRTNPQPKPMWGTYNVASVKHSQLIGSRKTLKRSNLYGDWDSDLSLDQLVSLSETSCLL